jgi:tRNA-splicing ligase RtcB (3'-phosphate/5'-hydroxy nucleic acid ligase)
VTTRHFAKTGISSGRSADAVEGHFVARDLDAPYQIWGDNLEATAVQQGAGRRMSRTRAKEMFTWETAQRFLRERGVTLLSAGLDEVPMADKDIDEVMAAQRDLVEPLARFDPRLVKMAPSGEPPED